MKLADVSNGLMAWQSVSTFRLPAKLSYRVARYAKKVESEGKRINRQKSLLVSQAAGTPPDEMVTIHPGTPEMVVFAKSWEEFLAGDSDLQACDRFTMDEVLEALNEPIAPDILMALDPFFPEATGSIVKLVKDDQEVDPAA